MSGNPYDPRRLKSKQVLRTFYPVSAHLPDNKVYTEFDTDSEIVALRSALEADEEHAKDILAESRILREALERIADNSVSDQDDYATICLLRAIAREALANVGGKPQEAASHDKK